MQTEATDAFDITKEPQNVRELMDIGDGGEDAGGPAAG
jgi:hypothetical protein